VTVSTTAPGSPAPASRRPPGAHAIKRVEGADDIGLADDAGDAERGQHREPDAHDRAEQAADAGVPCDWIMNSATRMTTAQGTTKGCSSGATTSRPSTALSTEIAGVISRRVEEGDADDGEADHECLRSLALGQAQGEGGEREDAAFAAVVGARDQQDVFDRDDDDESPEHQREHAEDGVVDAR
jgi:hypothetical protein